MNVAKCQRETCRKSVPREGNRGKETERGTEGPGERQELGDIALITTLGSVVGGCDRNDLAVCLTMETGLKSERVQRLEEERPWLLFGSLFTIHAATASRKPGAMRATSCFSRLVPPSFFAFPSQPPGDQAEISSAEQWGSGLLPAPDATADRIVILNFLFPHFSSRAWAIVLLSSVRLGKFADRSTLMILY